MSRRFCLKPPQRPSQLPIIHTRCHESQNNVDKCGFGKAKLSMMSFSDVTCWLNASHFSVCCRKLTQILTTVQCALRPTSWTMWFAFYPASECENTSRDIYTGFSYCNVVLNFTMYLCECNDVHPILSVSPVRPVSHRLIRLFKVTVCIIIYCCILKSSHIKCDLLSESSPVVWQMTHFQSCLLVLMVWWKNLIRLNLSLCRHVFHKVCVDPWLNEHCTCPMCKLNILKALGIMVSYCWHKQTTGTDQWPVLCTQGYW